MKRISPIGPSHEPARPPHPDIYRHPRRRADLLRRGAVWHAALLPDAAGGPIAGIRRRAGAAQRPARRAGHGRNAGSLSRPGVLRLGRFCPDMGCFRRTAHGFEQPGLVRPAARPGQHGRGNPHARARRQHRKNPSAGDHPADCAARRDRSGGVPASGRVARRRRPGTGIPAGVFSGYQPAGDCRQRGAGQLISRARAQADRHGHAHRAANHPRRRPFAAGGTDRPRQR